MYQHWMTAREKYITNAKEAEKLYEEILDLDRTHKLRVETRLNGEVKEWLLTTKDKILLLRQYLVGRIGVKVKVQVIDKVATGYTLQPLKY